MLGTISGALARSLKYIYIYPITLNGYIYSPGKKNRKNQKKSKKKKNARNNFWGPCQVLNVYMYIVAYIAARIYRGWHESQECAIFKLR